LEQCARLAAALDHPQPRLPNFKFSTNRPTIFFTDTLQMASKDFKTVQNQKTAAINHRPDHRLLLDSVIHIHNFFPILNPVPKKARCSATRTNDLLKSFRAFIAVPASRLKPSRDRFHSSCASHPSHSSTTGNARPLKNWSFIRLAELS
jgi:hypothetical protein